MSTNTFLQMAKTSANVKFFAECINELVNEIKEREEDGRPTEDVLIQLKKQRQCLIVEFRILESLVADCESTGQL